MSSAELSLEISHLVSRALGGERVDATAAGEALAVKYAGLGMTGELIAKAIARAAGMVGVALDASAAEAAPASPATAAAAIDAAATQACSATLDNPPGAAGVGTPASGGADPAGLAIMAADMPDVAGLADAPGADLIRLGPPRTEHPRGTPEATSPRPKRPALQPALAPPI